MSLGELARCASDASELTALLTRHQPDGPGSDPGVREAHRRALEALRRAEESARAPFGIGLVGEVSAGKSLLLGLLLGRPELLPVGEEAVTGNVTLIHAKAAPPHIRESYPSAVRVEYFTQAQTLDYLRHLRDELADQAQKAGLSPQVVLQLRELPIHEPDCGGLLGFRDTYLTGGLAQSLAGVLQEIGSLDRALRRMHESGLPLLGHTAELNDELARAAVVLPGADAEQGVDPRAGSWSGASDSSGFSARPAGPAHSGLGVPLTADLLRATLPLIRRLVREVRVAPSVWDLSAFPGAELRLLDFPGLNSDFSAVRDAYVCGTELHSVHTLLMLLKAGGPATDTLRRVFRMWHAAQRSDSMEDSVIALISRFHDLRVPESVLESYRRDTQQLTRERLLGDVAVLGELLASAERLVTSPDTPPATMGPTDRVLLTSAMRAMGVGGWNERVSKEFRDKCDLDARTAEADERAKTWRDIGRRLSADALSGGLDRILTDFADDGGLERLRGRLGDHVSRHGAAFRLGQFAERREDVVEALRELHTALEASGGRDHVDHQAETAVREHLIALQTVWNEVRDRAKVELLDAHRLYSRRAQSTPGPSLFTELERETAERVYTWPSWNSLLGTVDEEHVDPRRLQGGHRVPVRTDEFFAEFRDSCREIEAAGSARLLAAVEAWLLGYQRRVVATAEQLATVITPEVFALLRSTSDGEKAAARLSRATSLQWLRDEAEKVLRDMGPAEVVDEEKLREHFPLRPGHILPWHPDSLVASGMDASSRHQTTIARHRREMAAMVLRQSLAGLARRQRLLASHLRTQAASFITDELRVNEMAGALATAAAGGRESTLGLADVAEQLRRHAADSVYSWEPSAETGSFGSGSPAVFPVGPFGGGDGK
ncbi:dynamin family protein [Streptomyces sp. HD]|uniref:dynamin family protein n=1 Tax=Streptomyces sp. HD TaxID=3020892 RepID=UPI00233101D7|nr:dynamin family protein [Streptomyces sp. HD]MDC0772732.1 dynamin family protein [Streptomyces sp. HD]